jgi:hypothetical protein
MTYNVPQICDCADEKGWTSIPRNFYSPEEMVDRQKYQSILKIN